MEFSSGEDGAYHGFFDEISSSDTARLNMFSRNISGMLPALCDGAVSPAGYVMKYAGNMADMMDGERNAFMGNMLKNGVELAAASTRWGELQSAMEDFLGQTAGYFFVKNAVLENKYSDAVISGRMPDAFRAEAEMKRTRLDLLAGKKPRDFCLYGGIAESLMSDQLDRPSLYVGDAGMQPYMVPNPSRLSKSIGKN
jgi:hypothetical protein